MSSIKSYIRNVLFESKLRGIIRQVLLENINDIDKFTDPKNLDLYISKGSFEDFIRSKKDLNISKEDKDNLLILMAMLWAVNSIEAPSKEFYLAELEIYDEIYDYGFLSNDFEIIWVMFDEYTKLIEKHKTDKEIDLEPWEELADYFDQILTRYLGVNRFSSVYDIFDWIKGIGKNRKEFAINASNYLLNYGFAKDDSSYKSEIIELGIKIVKLGANFADLVNDIEGIRKKIDMGLKNGRFIEIFMRYVSELGVEAGESQENLIRYALDIDNVDSNSFSYSIYDVESPYEYMKKIYEFMSNISYANDLVGRF